MACSALGNFMQNHDHKQEHDYFAMETFLGSVKKPAFARLRRGGAALRKMTHFAIQMFFASVKNRSASSPPSRPTPLAFMPPKGPRPPSRCYGVAGRSQRSPNRAADE